MKTWIIDLILRLVTIAVCSVALFVYLQWNKPVKIAGEPIKPRGEPLTNIQEYQAWKPDVATTTYESVSTSTPTQKIIARCYQFADKKLICTN